MNYLDELYEKKERYTILKSNVQDLISSLSNVINKFDIPINNIGKNFIIDNVSTTSNKLSRIKSNLIVQKNSLNTLTLNKIKDEINYYENAIYEEEERLRLLEEEKLQKQKAATMNVNPIISD